MKKYKEEKGSMAVYVIVTLVSFCLILTGIYISTSSVRKAQIKTDIKIKEVYENSYASNDSNNIGDLIDNGKIKIGDYVAYTPTGEASYTVEAKYSTKENREDETINREGNLNWRVLDKTEDGKVRLISATETKSKVSFGSVNGYNNAVYLLDELCNTLYKGENAIAKNLKIEDIQDKMDLNYWDYHYAYGAIGSPSNMYYPAIFAQEKDQIVDGKTGTLGLSEQNGLITDGRKLANSWTVTSTLWIQSSMSASNYIQPIYYELYHGSISDWYWLSSRSAEVDSNTAIFNLSYLNSYGVQYWFMANSLQLGMANLATGSFRPVVSLDSNVEIDTSVKGKDGSSPEKAWVIK